MLDDGTRELRPFHPSSLKFIYYGMTYNHPSMFVHRDTYKDLKYNTELRALSDYEFVLTNKLRWPDIFLYIPNTYVNYRLDGISGSMNFLNAIKEGYISRKNAGLNLPQNIISVLIRTLRVLIDKILL